MTDQAWELTCRECECVGWTLGMLGVTGALYKRQLSRRCPECWHEGEGTRTVRVVAFDELPEDARAFLRETAHLNHDFV